MLRALIATPVMAIALIVVFFSGTAVAGGYDDSGVNNGFSSLSSQFSGNGFLDRMGFSHDDVASGVKYDTSIGDSIDVGYGAIPGALSDSSSSSALTGGFDDTLSSTDTWDSLGTDDFNVSLDSFADTDMLSLDGGLSIDSEFADTEMMCAGSTTATYTPVSSGDYDDDLMDDAGYGDEMMDDTGSLPMAPVTTSGGGC